MYAISQPYVVSLYSLKRQRKYLTGPERSLFIAAAMSCQRPELRSLCLVLAYTGCRISEALNLIAASIEVTEASIALRSLKKRKKVGIIRQVPVPAALIDELKAVHDLSVAGQRLWTWSRSRACNW